MRRVAPSARLVVDRGRWRWIDRVRLSDRSPVLLQLSYGAPSEGLHVGQVTRFSAAGPARLHIVLPIGQGADMADAWLAVLHFLERYVDAR